MRGNPPVLKRYGQHFLADKKVLQDIADAVGAGPGDTVLEIGPGRGALTDLLVERAGRVVAIEIDRALAAGLEKRYAGRSNVEIVQQDVMQSDFAALAGADYLLAGNVPYYITTPIIFKALEPPVARRAVFLVQREVAERMQSSAGDEEYGALTINVAATAAVEIIRAVPPESFTPPPKVDSAVIRITPRPDALIAREELHAFQSFVQAAFGMRRKQIQKVIRSVRGLSIEEADRALAEVGIERTARPETLSPEIFVRLFELLRGE
jgi:16S rRNA (adenine1518-N6/adenine1519-N6)-dimethyltransferase